MIKKGNTLFEVTKDDLRLLNENPEEFWAGVKAIGSFAFGNLSELDRLVVPEGVIKINFLAFVNNMLEGCENLREIVVPATVSEIDVGVLTGCSNLEKIEVDKNNPNFKSEGNCLLTKDGKTLVAGCKNSVIPKVVEEIAEFAFADSGLKVANLPKGLKKIKNKAFYSCKELESFTLPCEIEDIAMDAFENTKLEKDNGKIVVEYQNGKFATVGYNDFYKFENLKSLRSYVEAKVRDKTLQTVADAVISSCCEHKEAKINKEKN